MYDAQNKTYYHHYSITAADMNKQFRITPNAILLYYQDAWARLMSNQHMAAFDVVKQQKIWVVTEFEANMSQVNTFWSDQITVEIWNSQLTPARVYADYRIYKRDTAQEHECGTLIANGYAAWSLLNINSKRLERLDSMPIPVAQRQDSAPHKKEHFNSEGITLKTIRHKVNLLDLDFNMHVNNRSYLSIALLTATDEFLNTMTPVRMVIHWLHETYLDDTLTCSLIRPEGAEENTFVHILTSENQQKTAEIYSVWEPLVNPQDVCLAVSRE